MFVRSVNYDHSLTKTKKKKKSLFYSIERAFISNAKFENIGLTGQDGFTQ